MDWKRIGKGLLLAAGIGAVWGVLRSVFDLQMRLGAAFQIVNIAVIAGGTIWFVRFIGGTQQFVKGGGDLPTADDEGTSEDDEGTSEDKE